MTRRSIGIIVGTGVYARHELMDRTFGMYGKDAKAQIHKTDTLPFVESWRGRSLCNNIDYIEHFIFLSS